VLEVAVHQAREKKVSRQHIFLAKAIANNPVSIKEPPKAIDTAKKKLKKY